MNKVDRFSVELGPSFNLSSTPAVYKEWFLQEEWTTHEITDVTPGEEVSLLDFTVEVPENAAKLIKYTTDNKVLGFFLNSNDELIDENVAYIVGPTENWIEIDSSLINSYISFQGALE